MKQTLDYLEQTMFYNGQEIMLLANIGDERMYGVIIGQYYHGKYCGVLVGHAEKFRPYEYRLAVYPRFMLHEVDKEIP